MSVDVSSEMRVVTSVLGRHLFVTDGSRIYDLPPQAETDQALLAALLPEIAPRASRRIDGTPLPPPPLQTLSLNLAQACNMSCGYCYADGGARTAQRTSVVLPGNGSAHRKAGSP